MKQKHLQSSATKHTVEVLKSFNVDKCINITGKKWWKEKKRVTHSLKRWLKIFKKLHHLDLRHVLEIDNMMGVKIKMFMVSVFI